MAELENRIIKSLQDENDYLNLKILCLKEQNQVLSMAIVSLLNKRNINENEALAD